VSDHKARGVKEYIVQNLADVDFYKLTMLQFIWFFFRKTIVTFRFKNRTDVNLLEYIDLDELKHQLERVTKMSFPRWCRRALRKDYGHIFRSDFLTWLGQLRLPMPNVGVSQDGRLLVEVTGPWVQVMLWETITMCIVNRLYFLAKMKELGLDEKDVLAEGERRTIAKFERLGKYPGLPFTDFGTRRRWSFRHHFATLLRAIHMIPNQLVGTSNVLLGLKLEIKLIGTMAHELPMALQIVFWQLDEASPRLVSQKKLWEMWEEFYGGELTISLPDTYGNDFGLDDFTEFAQAWAGMRHDSGPATGFGEKAIAFYESLQIDPMTKMLVFSDGLTDEKMIELWVHFLGRIMVSFGWGTHLTNDMGFDQWHDGNRGLKPLSIVMKLVAVMMIRVMMETVKLSDNPKKANGPQDKIDRIISKTDYDLTAHEAVTCEV
jgi:nicotinate phosphoribosyltransferase